MRRWTIRVLTPLDWYMLHRKERPTEDLSPEEAAKWYARFENAALGKTDNRSIPEKYQA